VFHGLDPAEPLEAATISALVENGTCPITSHVAGFTTSRVAPTDSTQAPST
jgi:hypothetical protein